MCGEERLSKAFNRRKGRGFPFANFFRSGTSHEIFYFSRKDKAVERDLLQKCEEGRQAMAPGQGHGSLARERIQEKAEQVSVPSPPFLKRKCHEVLTQIIEGL